MADASNAPTTTQPECAKPPRIKVESHSSTGFLWLSAWLFTIGYLHLTFWKAVLAILLWPYYIGYHLSTLVH
jgi:hypothetical protein